MAYQNPQYGNTIWGPPPSLDDEDPLKKSFAKDAMASPNASFDNSQTLGQKVGNAGASAAGKLAGSAIGNAIMPGIGGIIGGAMGGAAAGSIFGSSNGIEAAQVKGPEALAMETNTTVIPTGGRVAGPLNPNMQQAQNGFDEQEYYRRIGALSPMNRRSNYGRI